MHRGMTEDPASEKLTLWQRLAMREARRASGRKRGEPLRAEDWAAV